MSVTVATEGSTPSIPVSDRTSHLLSLLDADDIKTVEETKALIHESLHLSRDPGLLNALVEYYLKTRSPATLQILSTIHEARTQVLFEKMNECLKLRTSRSDTLTLLGHIVRKQPSWLYKIIKTPLFETLVRCMKGDTDILVLTSGILTITTLLPLVPASIGPWLRDLFDIYTRLCAFRTYRQGNAPEVYHLHLHVAVYLFFHRLYAMYPNNFLVHLKTIYGEPSKQSLFQGTIKPMLEYVRLHPCVVTETTHTETEKHRWRKKEPHDIVIECMKVSLDPVDRIQEDGGFTTSSTSRHSHQEMFADKSISSVLTMSGEMTENHVPDMVRLKERRMSDSATQTGKSLQSGDSGTDSCSIPVISPEEITPGWSPSDLCGLSTPPSSQMSPSTSNPDLLSSLNLYSQCSTPAVMYTPGQSPTTSLGGDVAYLHGPSFLSSAVGSKVKNAVLGWTHSGRGTPVYGGKAASHEGQLTKALYSALAQHSNEEVLSAPAALGGHQTSTPKASERCDSEDEGAMSDVGRSFEHGNLPTQTSDDVLSTFENKSADIEVGVDVRISEEQVNTDSSHCNKVSPKEEYRDFEEQDNFASGKEDAKSLGSHLSVASSEFSKESVTPVGGQSLDSASLPNTPVQYKGVFDCERTSTEPKEESDVASQSHYDFDGSLPCGDPMDQLSITASEKDREFPSVNGSETSVATEDTSVDSAVMHGSASVPQQNHHNLHSCDLFASLPQLLPFLKGEQDDVVHSSTGDEGGSLGVRHQGASRASPVEILDNYLKVGSSVHYGELARIPLVSQSGTSWTHFGGEPPVDEVEILRGQVQLLHNQLLFERHKCDLHAVRNRRLIGKTFKAVQYQEELQATKDQLRLQEEKMRELTEALDKQLEDSRRLKEVTSSWDHHQRTELRNLVNANDKVQYTNQELQKKLEAQQKDFDTQQMEVHQFRARVFTLENEREKLKEELSEKDQLTGQVNQLVKELLMMGELNQSQKDTIQKLSLMEGQTPESSMQLHSCHRELSTAKQTVRKQKAELEALTNKLADMESALSNKDIEIRELKKFTEGLKGTYIGKIQSLEEKYSAQKRITQALESYVLDLQSSIPVEGLRKQDKGETLVVEHDAK